MYLGSVREVCVILAELQTSSTLLVYFGFGSGVLGWGRGVLVRVAKTCPIVSVPGLHKKRVENQNGSVGQGSV